jgi:hypothetical protein
MIKEVEREREVGTVRANGNSPCGEMRRMFTRETQVTMVTEEICL